MQGLEKGANPLVLVAIRSADERATAAQFGADTWVSRKRRQYDSA